VNVEQNQKQDTDADVLDLDNPETTSTIIPNEMEEVVEEMEEEEPMEEPPKQNTLAILEENVDEVDLTVPDDDNQEVFTLKKRNDVYFNMYKEAKRKAKIARDLAISSYLEAKRIRHNYLANQDVSDEDTSDEEEEDEDEDEEEEEEEEEKEEDETNENGKQNSLDKEIAELKSFVKHKK